MDAKNTQNYGRCKNCKWRIDGWCNCPKLREKTGSMESLEGDELVYCYHEDGGFEVGENFGCVHYSEE